jgi:hypothetical protein
MGNSWRWAHGSPVCLVGKTKKSPKSVTISSPCELIKVCAGEGGGSGQIACEDQLKGADVLFLLNAFGRDADLTTLSLVLFPLLHVLLFLTADHMAVDVERGADSLGDQGAKRRRHRSLTTANEAGSRHLPGPKPSGLEPAFSTVALRSI